MRTLTPEMILDAIADAAAVALKKQTEAKMATEMLTDLAVIYEQQWPLGAEARTDEALHAGYHQFIGAGPCTNRDCGYISITDK